MSQPADWDIREQSVQTDQRAAYDRMREQCPVARDSQGH